MSKIENSSEEPAYETAIKLISRLGITPNEFEYIKNKYSWNVKFEIIYSFNNLSFSTQKEEIDLVLKKCGPYQSDIEIRMIITILHAMKIIDEKDGFKQAQQLVSPIWFDYLSKIDTWTMEDLYILNTIFFLFDKDTMNSITNLAIKVIEQKYPFLESLKNNFLLNKSYLEMKRKKFNLALSYLNKSFKLSKNLLQYDKLLITKGRICICLKNKNGALECVHLLEKIEAEKAAIGLKIEIKEFNFNF